MIFIYRKSENVIDFKPGNQRKKSVQRAITSLSCETPDVISPPNSTRADMYLNAVNKILKFPMYK